MRVVIVGGGITGLAAAYYLSKKGVRATVLEAADRPGGVIQTERSEGFVIEGGPDSFIAQKPWAAELCRELGLDLIPSRSGRVYVLHKGRLRAMPEGMMLTVPSKVLPFLLSPLISVPGKLRAAMDLVLPRGGGAEDESLASFVRRRLGQEVLETIAEPLMAGIFVAPAERLSLKATFPRFLDMEREHRSLILASRRIPRTEGPLFLSLRGGMATLVEALVARLPDVRCRQRVLRVEPGKVVTADGVFETDHAVLAVPARIAAELVGGRLADALRAIPYVDSATVSMAFSKLDLPEGTGFVVPKREGRRIVACTWSSAKFEGRAPDDCTLVRCFFKNDIAGDLVTPARRDLEDILGFQQAPLFTRVYRWRAVNPIYEVGHEGRVAAIEELLPPGLHVAGSAYRGVGIPDCIRDARRIADRMAP